MAIITEKEGDIFDAPLNSILLQACNAQGIWGSGVALQFKIKFPKAYRKYKEHCNTKPPVQPTLEAHQRSLAGTFFMTTIGNESNSSIPEGSFYHITSLITSEGYGKDVSDAATILENTAKGIEALKATIDYFKERDLPVGDVWAVKINSGLFGVPWKQTKKVLEQGKIDMVVVTPPSKKKIKKEAMPARRDSRDSQDENSDSKDLKSSANGGMTEDRPKKRGRPKGSKNSSPSKTGPSPKKRKKANAETQTEQDANSGEQKAQELQKIADREARHAQQTAKAGPPREAWKD